MTWSLRRRRRGWRRRPPPTPRPTPRLLPPHPPRSAGRQEAALGDPHPRPIHRAFPHSQRYAPPHPPAAPEMKFLDINLTKDSSLLIHAIHSPFFKKSAKQESTSLFMTEFCRTETLRLENRAKTWVWEDSSLCPETSTKNAVQEFRLWCPKAEIFVLFKFPKRTDAGKNKKTTKQKKWRN